MPSIEAKGLEVIRQKELVFSTITQQTGEKSMDLIWEKERERERGGRERDYRVISEM